MRKGIDVSGWQRNPAAVPWAGCDFAAVRVSWGAVELDPLAREHLTRAQDAGCGVLIAYHYANVSAGGDRQARHFLDRVADLEATFGPLGHALDLEHLLPPALPFDVPTYRGIAAAFLEEQQARSGRPLLVYGNLHDLTSFDLPPSFASMPLWLAAHRERQPSPPPPWVRSAIWQHGIVDGFDRNVAAGSLDDLRTALGLHVPPTSRALQLARALGEVGVTETARNTSPRIAEYLAGCERGGVLLGLVAEEWCAAFQGWCGARPWRAAVWEMVEDARAAGTLRLASEAYWPAPGDLAVYGRLGQTPMVKGGRGHVGRVVKAQGVKVIDVSGNSGPAADRVAVMARPLGEVLAWIAV
jgi:GH25 family lysozyme M1 (1,4-beta-N-acetylmuramidase)